MQPYNVRRFGEVILDRKEQERWCRAVLLGCLAACRSCGAKAEVARTYDKLELREGDKVLIIGECIEPCGFVDDNARASGQRAESTSTGEARDNYLAKKRGRGRSLATWPLTTDARLAWKCCG
jgi:hypothetical protein